MVSMERFQYAQRARFNRPYRCIEVKEGNSTDVVRNLEWNAPLIAWLDYDGCLEQSVVDDIDVLLGNCPRDSVVLLTINAVRTSYRPRNTDAEKRRTRGSTALGQIELLLGDGVISPRFEPQQQAVGSMHGDVPEGAFAECLAEALLAFMVHRVRRSGREWDVERKIPMEFLPLFNVFHKDGADMVTVGGVLCGSSRDDQPWRHEALGIKRNPQGMPDHIRLDLVPLTLKEKLVLDSCLPQSEQGFVAEAKERGICLDAAELTKYWRYYDYFPVFLETAT